MVLLVVTPVSRKWRAGSQKLLVIQLSPLDGEMLLEAGHK